LSIPSSGHCATKYRSGQGENAVFEPDNALDGGGFELASAVG
jgi:hypothetical protein